MRPWLSRDSAAQIIAFQELGKPESLNVDYRKDILMFPANGSDN